VGTLDSDYSTPWLNHILHPNWDYMNLNLAKGNDITPKASGPTMTSENAYLLRIYEKGIATWMDVFDCSLSYQQALLNLVPSLPLLLNSTCALAARQLSLISSPMVWTPVAERYYGQSLRILLHFLNDSPVNMEHAMVAAILLSSYELLAFPGHDYQRHFKGAKSFVDSLHAYKSSSRLIRASFWIYARQEVGEAINLGCPTMHNPKLWPKLDPSEGDHEEDSWCNDALRLCAETACFVFQSGPKSRTKKRAKERLALQAELDGWLETCPSHLKGIEYDENGYSRYWFPRPNFGELHTTYDKVFCTILTSCSNRSSRIGIVPFI
jgi:hypothetical protein